MNSLEKDAKIAGVLYFLLTITGIFTLIYIPGKLYVRGNAASTVANILASERLFNINIVVGLISLMIFLFLALALYQLLKDVNKQYASVMVLLVLVQIPIGFINQLNQLAALLLARGADFLSVFDKPQRDALAMLFLDVSNKGAVISELLWGLWLLPLGLLVYWSGFLPRFLGVWLIINCFAYVILCFTGLLAPQHHSIVNNIATPALFGELAFMLWLLIKGIKVQPAAAAVQTSV
jgi:hypothetical protein